jgi:DNA-binding MarR family transcriptional regulator
MRIRKKIGHKVVKSGSASEKSTTAGQEPATIELDAQLCFALYGAAHAFTRTYKPLLDPLGLTYPQYLVMITLWEKDGQPVKAIGDRLGLDSGTLSPLLKRLEQSGLVTRQRDRDDERQVKITLTADGTELRHKAGSVTSAIGKALGCGLEDVVALRDELIALKKRLLAAE